MRQLLIIASFACLASCGVQAPEPRIPPAGPVLQGNPGASPSSSGSEPNGASSGSGTVGQDPSPTPQPTPDSSGCNTTQVTPTQLCEDDFAPGITEQPWRHPVASAVAKAQGAAKHRGIDIIVTPADEQWLIGKFAYGPLDYDLQDETVEIWLQSPACTWSKLASVLTSNAATGTVYNGVEDDGGRVFYKLPPAKALEVGTYRVKLVVLGDLSTADLTVNVWPRGTAFAVTDIDGTMTTSENDGLWTAFDPSSPDPRLDAADLMAAYAAKNIHPIFLTARPEMLTNGTRQWLGAHRFPYGPLHLSQSNFGVQGQDAADYKGAFVQGLVASGFSFVWGVGNRWSDYEAYVSAGIAPEQVLLYDDGKIGGATPGAVLHTNYTQFLTPILCEPPHP